MNELKNRCLGTKIFLLLISRITSCSPSHQFLILHLVIYIKPLIDYCLRIGKDSCVFYSKIVRITYDKKIVSYCQKHHQEVLVFDLLLPEDVPYLPQ